jgi:tetratricopeptide (TPR) repeat protein
MCLAFCKLDDRPSFRKWARTARLGAEEAGDPVTLSWVLAHESYGHYYSGDLQEALDTAQHAQELVTRIPCVGSALAAALEARIHAMMGQPRETREALARAEKILSFLTGADLTPSAFGYNEAQLRFHESSAYTHLRDTQLAFQAQDQALELCTRGDYTDWALTRLDRATCLTHMGDMASGLTYAAETLNSLTQPQRQGIIAIRGHGILRELPSGEQKRHEARELRDILMELADKREIEGR